MKTDDMSSSSPLVEHVRTIHFTLIAISAGLILFLSLVKSYNSTDALEQINELMQLQRKWSPEWIRSLGIFNGPETESGVVAADAPFICILDWPSRTLAYHAQVTNDWVLYGTTSWSPASFPKTLTEFEDWWNLLQKPQRVDFVDEVGKGVFYLDNSNQAFPLRVSSTPTLTQSDKTLQLEAIVGNPNAGELKLKGRLSKPDPQGYVELPVIATTRTEIDQSSLIERELKQAKPGLFRQSFPDLSASARGLESFDLEQLQVQLIQEASRDADTSFDSGWLKIPAQQITSCGIVMVLLVQTYFLVILRELVNRLYPSDPGWDTPWIGMYQSGLAQALVFVSVVLLPLSAVFFVLLRARSRWIVLSGGNRGLPPKGIFPFAVWNSLGIGSFVLSCLLCCLCWKFCWHLRSLPRKNKNDAVTQTGADLTNPLNPLDSRRQ
jgi:hypothetical protein